MLSILHRVYSFCQFVFSSFAATCEAHWRSNARRRHRWGVPCWTVGLHMWWPVGRQRCRGCLSTTRAEVNRYTCKGLHECPWFGCYTMNTSFPRLNIKQIHIQSKPWLAFASGFYHFTRLKYKFFCANTFIFKRCGKGMGQGTFWQGF